jgi:Rps23 Pro-64 3,4-dihydroxylase Tpa1-like proline 4-hydroxylase
MTDPPTLPPDELWGLVRRTDFLPPEEHDALLADALALERSFVESSTEGADDYRQSLVFYDGERIAGALLARVRALVPELCRRFALPPLPAAARTEAQLTAHNDGHFYKIHPDNDGIDAAARELTFVYYFHRAPRAFTGGDLLVYEREGRHGMKLGPGTPVAVEPTDNSIVFFRAGRLHAVTPVACPSRAFADSRFTINGWVWR